MTHKLYINAYFIISVAHPGTRTWRHACMVGVVAAAIPRGPQQPEIKYFN